MSAPLDSRQIRAFCVLARTGSFAQTARELNLSQSGVTHSIAALENDIGCRLLNRLDKKVALTPAGEQFLHHAQKILQEIENARVSLTNLGKWGGGRLRLGASTTACQYIIPTVLREFKESFPDHSITIEPGDTPDLVSLLLDHKIDLALTLEAKRETRLDWHLLFTDELQFVTSPEHPWAVARRVERSEIARQNYILYSKRSVTFRLIESYFRQEKVTLKTVIEVGSVAAAKELVQLGIGISILAPWVAGKEIESGALVALPLGRRKLPRRWGILCRKGRKLDLPQETFMGLCKAATALIRV